MSSIRIGFECTLDRLRADILSHPGRYFFILLVDDRAALCIRSCDGQGEELKEHEINCLMPDDDGNLISVFEERLEQAVKEQDSSANFYYGLEHYTITPDIAETIADLPGLADCVLKSLMLGGRHLVFYPPLEI